MKVVINKCFGGFGLSEKAYERLIELGIPVRAYIKPKRGDDGRYTSEPDNEGEVIFDRNLGSVDPFGGSTLFGRYWDTWTDDSRDHPLVVRVVEELGDKASGQCAELKVVEIPDDVEWAIDEYDGMEHIAEAHRTWG